MRSVYGDRSVIYCQPIEGFDASLQRLHGLHFYGKRNLLAMRAQDVIVLFVPKGMTLDQFAPELVFFEHFGLGATRDHVVCFFYEIGDDTEAILEKNSGAITRLRELIDELGIREMENFTGMSQMTNRLADILRIRLSGSSKDAGYFENKANFPEIVLDANPVAWVPDTWVVYNLDDARRVLNEVERSPYPFAVVRRPLGASGLGMCFARTVDHIRSYLKADGRDIGAEGLVLSSFIPWEGRGSHSVLWRLNDDGVVPYGTTRQHFERIDWNYGGHAAIVHRGNQYPYLGFDSIHDHLIGVTAPVAQGMQKRGQRGWVGIDSSHAKTPREDGEQHVLIEINARPPAPRHPRGFMENHGAKAFDMVNIEVPAGLTLCDFVELMAATPDVPFSKETRRGSVPINLKVDTVDGEPIAKGAIATFATSGDELNRAVQEREQWLRAIERMTDRARAAA